MSDRPLRITLVISSLRGGGSARVLATMANHWAGSSREVTILTFDDASASPAYCLHPAVACRALAQAAAARGALHAVALNLRRVKVLRRSIKASAPQVVISFLHTMNVRTVLACHGLGVPVVVSERCDPSGDTIGKTWDLLRKITYRRAARVVAQTQHALGYFSAAIRRRAEVIPNPLQISMPRGGVRACGRAKVIVAMGRLTHQKGFDLLSRAFSIVTRKHPTWSLVIWGEGPLRKELESLRLELGLGTRISFPGWTSDPFRELFRAGLFVLSSRYEGFPNVLCEAMACGAPVVSFDCASGPGEIIRKDVDGILVPPEDVDALADAIDRLLSWPSDRDRLGERATEIVARLDARKVMARWEAVVGTVVEQRLAQQ